MDKDAKYLTQFRKVQRYLYRNTASRSMTAANTGVPLQNVCYYVDMLRKQNQVAILKKDECEITGKKVQFLTTNPALFPRNNKQLKLFE